MCLLKKTKMKIHRIIRFFKSLWFHIYAGFPKSTQEEINNRWEICNSCEYIDKEQSQCKLCGCNLSNKKMFMNKLAWADQECPADKWHKIIRHTNVSESDNK